MAKLATMTRNTRRVQMLRDALHHLRSAIALLDAAEAPGHIAANLDLATHQLARELESHEPGASQPLACS